MKKLFIALLLLSALTIHAQTLTGMDENGNMTEMQQGNNGNFNPHSNDTTRKNKVVPKGIYVWTVDRKLGDIRKTEVDTLPHLYPQSTLSMGKYGQFNTAGSNYTARLSRIFIDRKETDQFLFSQLYDQVQTAPDEVHFTNTLSPITNLSYDNCGDKNNGEDHFQAKFAVNAGKRTGLGFDINYAYAPSYFQNQSTSHFNFNIYASHLGDKYQMHIVYGNRHQKATENGGITNDNYITHPELYSETYAENEIPTVLASNWNRNNSQHLFFTHRYSVGFYREVKMTDEEIEARKFATASKKQKEKKETKDKKEEAAPQGRPTGMKIAGREPAKTVPAQKPAAVANSSKGQQANDSLNTQHADSLSAQLSDSLKAQLNDSIAVDSTLLASTDTTRIKVTNKAMADSLLAIEARNDSLAALMKKEFVPVTSFIHTFELSDYERIYQAYQTPKNYYKDTYYQLNDDLSYPGDSIYDMTKHFVIKNTAGLALLEGFNKWAKAGIKAFLTHEARRFDMPEISPDNGYARMNRWTEQNISIGGRVSKTQGHTLHYQLTGETWIAGQDAGQLKVDFSTDLNFPLWGDTVRLAANAYFHRTAPTFYERNFHSKHLWWDKSLEMTTRTRVEGKFSYDKTRTALRVAIEEIQNFNYFGVSYDIENEMRKNFTASLYQQVGNLNIMTAQLEQKFTLGPINWENVLTYQMSSSQSVLPLPTFNAFTNLYVKFMIAKVLQVELGGSATYFTKYNAPEYVPQLNQFAVQENSASVMEIGNFPFVDVYANLHLKHARFFVMMNNVLGKTLNRMTYLTPHYPVNASIMHMGISWNFFN